MKRRKAAPVFKEYTMGQIVLLPTNLGELIPANHLVRVVNKYLEQMDLGPLLARYKGGGTSSYHPKMMLKVFVYAYTQKIYSSRRIAKALRESIPFLWLSGMNQPDFRTINRFRGVLLKGIIEEIFFAVLKLLITEGYVKLEDYFVDGTKVEAQANRYTAVWAKNTERYEKQLAEKVSQLMKQIEQIEREENERYGDQDLEEMGEKGPVDEQKLTESVEALNQQLQTPSEEAGKGEGEAEPSETPSTQSEEQSNLSAQIKAHLAALQQAVANQPKSEPLIKAVRTLAEDYLPRARKYEEQRRKLRGRNSYSKTDKDATFMRMKEDHRPGSQPKPAYNIQNGTENQFVVNFSVHQQAGDSTCLIPHLDQAKAELGRLPKKINSDAGYGSEENYTYLERERVDNYLKYNTFDREQKKRYRPNPYHADNMPYDPQQDVFTCPAAKPMRYLRTEHSHTTHGFPLELQVYSGADCPNCPLKEQCTRAANNRLIRVSFRLRKYRQLARENLLSEEGQRLRKQRGVDVEPVFGRIKENWGFRRFLLRGLQKVTIEWGLLCLAHNLAKVGSCQNERKLAVT
jgi:transposase